MTVPGGTNAVQVRGLTIPERTIMTDNRLPLFPDSPGRIERRKWSDGPKRQAQIAYLERDAATLKRSIEYFKADIATLKAKGLNTERKEQALANNEARLARTTAQLAELTS